MNYFFLIAFIGFFLWIFRNTLAWVALWQTKEYRLDRLSVHLRETLQGKQLFVSPIMGINWMLLFTYSIYPTSLHDSSAAVLYIGAGAQVIVEAVSGYKLRRPVRTMKALVIIFLSLFSLVVIYLFSGVDSFMWLLFLDNLLILIIALFVLLFALPTKFYIIYKIRKAQEVIKQHQNLLVIAVSGSYGKSSTKEYIAQVLSQKYHVVKTPGSNNTPIGLAATILSRITNETKIFVVEMGAYKKGEVAELCQIVQPNISVTTSVSDQHVSLYGSLQHAIDTERELLNALPKNGLALLNGNNEHTAKLYEETKQKKVLYTVGADYDSIPTIVGKDVVQKKEGLSFTVILNRKKIKCTTSLIGKHAVENILPAIFIADYLNIPETAIKRAVTQLVPPPQTMSRKVLPNGVICIDDTFNASPESVQAAISYMSVYEKQKILVLMPLVELGQHAGERHYEIGMHAASVCDYLFVTNKNFYAEMKKGIKNKKGKCQLIYKKIPDIVEEIIKIAKKDDVVVFEGKEAGKVLDKFLSSNS